MLRRLALAALLGTVPLPAVAAPVVEFAGYSWLVRTYGGGPGPNEWREANVRVDEAGLHLTIQEDGALWTCAEVVMLGPPLGFGTYSFEVEGDLAGLDSNAVLGLFNFPESDAIGPSGTNEIDIEIAQWNDPDNPNRLNWNVYPAVAGGGKGGHSQPLPLQPGLSTHSFSWSAERVDYVSHAGSLRAGTARPIGQWSYAPANAEIDVPQVPLVVHINLWLLDGRAPVGREKVEVTITDFRFTPE